jgi:hypothetical protein
VRTFALAQAFVRTVVDSAPNNVYKKVHIYPGPNLPDDPGRFIMLTRYGGRDFDVDGLIDNPSWQVRVASKQNDYDSGEVLADWIDAKFSSFHSQKVGDLWVVEIQRVGGAPSALMLDDADRTHFVCSYTASVESALVN